MITSIDGVRVGHWTDPVARTGCTVMLLPASTVASGEVRGAAPGTREFALLAPERSAPAVNAVVLTGGSAFGLAACDGVVRWCEERGIGVPTVAGPVPIVVGMVLFDLGVGDPSVRPGAAEGYAACVAALPGAVAEGSGPVGAGCGATVGKWRGPGKARPAGIGAIEVAGDGGLLVAALMAVNAVGDPREAGVPDKPRVIVRRPLAGDGLPAVGTEATTIGVVVTNAVLTKGECLRVAQAGHDGLARALDPAHTAFDGDALVVAATGEVPADPETVRSLAAWAVERAILAGAGRVES